MASRESLGLALAWRSLDDGRQKRSRARYATVTWGFVVFALVSTLPEWEHRRRSVMATAQAGRASGGGAVIAGRLVDRLGQSMKDVHVELFTKDPSGQFSPAEHEIMTNDAGEFRLGRLDPGRYYLCGTPPRLASGSAASEYAPTCYPGTTRVAEARAVIVGSTQAGDASFTMQTPARFAAVSGRAMDAGGKTLQGGSVLLSARNGFPRPVSTTIQANGRFTFSSIPPGDYVFRTVDLTTQKAGYQYGPDISVAAVVIRDSDVNGVDLVPIKAVTVSGRLTVPTRFAASVQAKFIRIGAVAATPPLIAPPPPAPVVKPDLTFQFTAPALPMFIQVLGAGPLIEKAVRVGGRNVLETPIDFRRGDVKDVEIELAEGPSLAATVTGPGADAAKDWCLLVFPQDRTKWKSPDPLGHSYAALWHLDAKPFAIRTLAPGSYFAVALNRFDNGWRDPDFLDSFRARALGFELQDGERKALRLRLITLP